MTTKYKTYPEWLTATKLSEKFYSSGDCLRDSGNYQEALTHYYAADLMGRVSEVFVQNVTDPDDYDPSDDTLTIPTI